MATYYVSNDGSNTNNGLGPDASHATNRPWLTPAKVFNTGSTVVPGDTVYFAPGDYYPGATLIPIASISSAANPTSFRGDPFNAQGFKTAAGVLLSPGIVRIDGGRTAGNEDTAGTLRTLFTLQTNDPSGLSFYHLALEAVGNVIELDTNGSNTILFEDCRLFAQNNRSLNVTTSNAWTAGRNWIFRRCIMLAASEWVIYMNNTTAAATANADLNILFEQCLIFGRSSFQMGTAAGNRAGGIYFDGCTIVGYSSSAGAITTVASTVSIATAVGDRLGIHLKNNLFLGGHTHVSAGTSGHVWDDGYNRAIGVNAPTNYTEAATSRRNTQANIIFPDLIKWGWPADYVGRGVFGWGPSAPTAVTASGGTNTGTDFYNTGLTRPWGAGPTIGAIELATITRDTTTLIDGPDSLKITGKGDIEFRVPVTAAATTISVKARQDASYGAGTKPQLIIVAEPDLGVVEQTITGVAAVSTTETLTTASFTPTAAGVVTVRLRSQAATAGAVNFDTLSKS